MELTGPWRAAAADEGLRRRYPEVDFDDGPWAELPVPGHWRSDPAFAGHDGPVLYRIRFETPRPATTGGQDDADDRRWWLTFQGIFYQADIWLDGAYLGDAEGYFAPHSFEITESLRARSEHVVGVEVSCSRPADRTAKRNLTGVFQHWDCLDPDWNPGGLWRPVIIEETGPVRISKLRAVCSEASPERAVVLFRAELDAATAGTVVLRTMLGELDHSQEVPVAAGTNEVPWLMVVNQPQLWWPHALGPQHLCDLTVEVRAPNDDLVSDRRSLRMGLRQVRMKHWITSINGERLFLKGSNQGPTRMALAEASADELERDILLAKEAGLDLVRIHGHISRPELYDAADRHGMLLWQDLPLQWGYARGVRKEAVRQAREAVDVLGHHPSLAIWCAHNEPLAIDLDADDVTGASLLARIALQQQLPTWNKTVLDGSLKRALEKADGTRPVLAHSGVWPHLGEISQDTHVYFGWYHGHERDFPGFCARLPRMAAFVSEFGAQAVPESAAFMEPQCWPELDWDRLGHTHALQKRFFERNGLGPDQFSTFDEWRRTTQEHQATVARFHIETLRRIKYRPAGGFCHFSLADGHPAVTWAVLDHQRTPKAAYHALAAACAPVIVVADRLDASYEPGTPVALDVHVVSDLRRPVEHARVGARLSWDADGEHCWAWEGSIPADTCVRVGTLQFVVPDVTGRLVLDLDLESADLKTSNQYLSVVTRTAK